jgi:DNA helicase-2/ATP-dependent DNA helicase PcrA
MNYDVFRDMNDEQIQAVKSTEGYYRVISGAGSGKTRALTRRYVHLVENLGISTDRILCATFTNKASKEMKKRIRSIIDLRISVIISSKEEFKNDIYV